MEKYIGVKLISAEPEYKPGMRVPVLGEKIVDENSGEGYKVVYEDGYTSWSPKEVFEKAYKKYDENQYGIIIDVDTRNGEWGFVGVSPKKIIN